MKLHFFVFKCWGRNEVDDFKHVADYSLKREYKKKGERIFPCCSVEINCEKHDEHDMLEQNVKNVKGVY